MNIVYFLVLALATYRMTSLLYQEKGPFNLFGVIRKMFGVIHVDKEPVGYPDTFGGNLFECFWCLSVWVGAGATLVYIFLPEISFYFALPLALSTISIIIEGGL